ncbi:MAG: 30S ribosome-binding factor RbfA [Ruminococcaceae bacterium]|nr:30S ribosome-binding factor RbfA [Oscillospiraceae bacterium]
MAKFRIERLNEEIRKELSSLVTTLKDPRIPPLLTITAVKTTNDLSHAKVYVSAMNADMKEVVTGLRAASGFLRRELASRLTVRKVPELHFENDTSYEHGLKIYAMLDDIKRQQREREETSQEDEN